jgi:hypothetical protein
LLPVEEPLGVEVVQHGAQVLGSRGRTREEQLVNRRPALAELQRQVVQLAGLLVVRGADAPPPGLCGLRGLIEAELALKEVDGCPILRCGAVDWLGLRRFAGGRMDLRWRTWSRFEPQAATHAESSFHTALDGRACDFDTGHGLLGPQEPPDRGLQRSRGDAVQRACAGAVIRCTLSQGADGAPG